ncbi:MAG: hypothetical protein MUF12_00190 [Sediminibacterium sp.]|jgi:hypothetical protein|nr:hypothetical protein [Sediminibacterium sp.]
MTQEYQIWARCLPAEAPQVLVSFSAEEQVEELLTRYIHNFCLYSKGSLGELHHRLLQQLPQWEATLSFSASSCMMFLDRQVAEAATTALMLYRGHQQLVYRVDLTEYVHYNQQ